MPLGNSSLDLHPNLRQPVTCFLSLYITLHFVEFYIDVYFFGAYFKWHNYFEMPLGGCMHK